MSKNGIDINPARLEAEKIRREREKKRAEEKRRRDDIKRRENKKREEEKKQEAKRREEENKRVEAERIQAQKRRAEEKKQLEEIKRQESKRREEEKKQEKKRRGEERRRRDEEKAALAEKYRVIAERKREKRLKVYAAIKKKLKNGNYAFSYGNFGVRSRVELEVSGDATSLLSRFASAGIEVVDLEKSCGKFRFKVQKKELSKAIAFLDEMCYNYKLGEAYGMPRFIGYWLARVGVLVGIAASALVMYISYSHIYSIHVSGNENIKTDAVLGALKAAGIESGASKSALDLDRVVATVNGIDGIADCDCSLSGTALYVNVLESKDFVVRESFGAYKSEYDAVVTRVVIRNGTAKVKRGDTVKRGDILADGTVYSTAGEPLYTAECEGEVYGNVSIGYDVSVSPIAVEYRRTGRVSKKSAVTVFGKTFFAPTAPYGSYESSVYTANYDVLIPLYVTTYEFRETESVEVERTVEQLADLLAETKREQLGFFDRDKFTVTYTAKTTDTGLINIHMFFSGEALISRGTAAPPPSERPEGTDKK